MEPLDMIDGGSVRTHYLKHPDFHLAISIEKKWTRTKRKKPFTFFSSNLYFCGICMSGLSRDHSMRKPDERKPDEKK